MAVGTVEHASAPTLRQAGNRGQVIFHPGGEDQAASRLRLTVCGEHAEAALQGFGSFGLCVLPLHGGIGEKLFTAHGSDLGGRGPVLGQEPVGRIGEAVPAGAGVDDKDGAACTGELNACRKAGVTAPMIMTSWVMLIAYRMEMVKQVTLYVTCFARSRRRPDMHSPSDRQKLVER